MAESTGKPYVIGLTGNIATGKSTVAAMLERLGACAIDADRLAHRVMCAGTRVNALIAERFGADVLTPDGEIDRRRLGAIVFADPVALRDLERIVHPAVIDETLRCLQACDRPVAVIEAIKLLEAGMQRYCRAIWVVTSPREVQVERLMRTRGLSEAEANLRIDAQPPQEEKVARADVVIENTSDLEGTWVQVVRAWNDIPDAEPAPIDATWADRQEG
ncbi:MAG: dephospho-CoA kinase [Anaerolineae bacterium]